ncbi:uncharacterized protein TNCV_4110671 [Trichonephila clavipes]|nr:uncharacterized protein TNCV_4110671 [Trichonephila clavipes]
MDPDRQQKLHPIFEELAKIYGQYWSRFGQRKEVCLTLDTVTSGNEAAYELAARGCHLHSPSSSVLSPSEMPSLPKAKMNLTPAYHWYAAQCPGLSLQCRRSRALQTALVCFRSGDFCAEEADDNGIKSIPLKDSVDFKWCFFKEMILRAAKKYIPRGKLKNRKPYLYLSSKSPLLHPLMEESKRIFENRDTGRSKHVRIELNKINANIKILYVQIKLDKLNDLCLGLDSRTSNGKLWKLLKNISNEQPQAEQCNTVLSEDGNLVVNDEQDAYLIGLHHQKISRLNFSVEDRNIKIRASRIVHG